MGVDASMAPHLRDDDQDLFALSQDSAPQWLGGALATLLWLLVAAFWRSELAVAGTALAIAAVVAVTGALLDRLGDLAVIPRRIAPWLSVLAAVLITARIVAY